MSFIRAREALGAGNVAVWMADGLFATAFGLQHSLILERFVDDIGLADVQSTGHGTDVHLRTADKRRRKKTPHLDCHAHERNKSC